MTSRGVGQVDYQGQKPQQNKQDRPPHGCLLVAESPFIVSPAISPCSNVEDSGKLLSSPTPLPKTTEIPRKNSLKPRFASPHHKGGGIPSTVTIVFHQKKDHPKMSSTSATNAAAAMAALARLQPGPNQADLAQTLAAMSRASAGRPEADTKTDKNINASFQQDNDHSAQEDTSSLSETSSCEAREHRNEGDEDDDEEGNEGRGDAPQLFRRVSSLNIREKQLLPKDFCPSESDVVCGRGKAYREWPGNESFRKLIEDRLEDYSNAKGRYEKGIIIREIVDQVRAQSSQGGGFVKQDPTGRWYEVGDFLAREKTSQHFRDCLHFRYSSSNNAKKRRRQMEAKLVEQAARDQTKHHAEGVRSSSNGDDETEIEEKNAALVKNGKKKKKKKRQRLEQANNVTSNTGAHIDQQNHQQLLAAAAAAAAVQGHQNLSAAAFGNAHGHPSPAMLAASHAAAQAAVAAHASTFPSAVDVERRIFEFAASNVPPMADQHLLASKQRVAVTAALAADALSDIRQRRDDILRRLQQQHLLSANAPTASHGTVRDLRNGAAVVSVSDRSSAEHDVISALQRLAYAGQQQATAQANLSHEGEENHNNKANRRKADGERSPQLRGDVISSTEADQHVTPLTATRLEVTVCAIQPRLRQKDESPLDVCKRILDSIEDIARSRNVDLFVLPELAPVGYSEDTFARCLPKSELMKKMYELIDEAFSERASKIQSYICYGTVGWKVSDEGDESFTIRQKVVDRSGKVVAVYDKIHLCDYGDCAETRFFQPGPKQAVSFTIDNSFTFGLLICADMRYPELSRALARDHKVDALLQPAAFPRDISFRTWKSFRETRAVENSVYFVGINYAGRMYGESSIVPPWVDDDHEAQELGTEEGFLISRLQRHELDLARTALPFYRELFS